MIRNSHSHTPFPFQAMKINPKILKTVVDLLILAGSEIAEATRKRRERRRRNRSETPVGVSASAPVETPVETHTAPCGSCESCECGPTCGEQCVHKP